MLETPTYHRCCQLLTISLTLRMLDSLAGKRVALVWHTKYGVCRRKEQVRCGTTQYWDNYDAFQLAHHSHGDHDSSRQAFI